MTLLDSPPRPRLTIQIRQRPRWLSRNAVLAADALFGLILLAVAFAGRLPSPSSSQAPAQPKQAAPVEIATRFGGLSAQTGFAVAHDGTLAVVDRSRQVVMRLDANGQPQAEWGPTFGPGVEAKDLVGIAPDGDGWFLLDRGTLRILRLDSQGHALPERTIDLGPLAVYGPNGLATDGRGNLYMADTGLDRILIFSANGTMTGTLGSAGTDLGKFKQPMFLAFGPDAAMYVSDWENSRVERFDADRHATSAWPLAVHAWGITVDSANRVFVPDGDHHLVRMFSPDGSLLAQIGADPGSSIPLDNIGQVAVSPDASRLWVLGSDGLARVDLSPYSAMVPTAGGQGVKTPLAVLGGLLLLLAVVGAALPRLRSLSIQTLRSTPLPARGEVARSAGEGSLRPQTWLADHHPSPLPSPRAGRGSAIPLAAPVGIVLLGAGSVGVVLAGLAVNDPVAKLDPWPRLAWLSVMSLVFAAGCVVSAQVLPWRWVLYAWPACTSQRAASLWRARRIETLVVLALTTISLILAVVAGVTWWQARFQTPDATRAALIWLAALLLALVALTPTARFRRPTLWALVPWALFALALIPRAWNNADLPYGLWFDEAEAGLQARKFLQTGLYTPITDTYGRDASLFYYFIAAAEALIPDPIVAGRIVAAVVGALCAPLMYFLGRELFGWRVGLAAGLLIATLRWHLDVSRLGWDPISLPLCAILAFWLLALSIRSGRFSHAVWAGLALGLGMHGYIGFRALPVVAVVLLLYGGWLRRWSPLVFISRVSAVAGGFVLSALPVLIFAVQDPIGFNGRVNQTLVLYEPVSQAQKMDELWTSLQKHLLMFQISGDANGRHNLPGAPMLDPLSGVLMVVGLGAMVARPFDWRSWLVFGWAIASMAGGIFTFPFEAPQAMRTVGITPVLALLAALALVLVIDRAAALIRGYPRATAAVSAAIGCALVAWIGVTNVTFFFGRQMQDPIVWESFSTRETLPSRAALDAPQPYEAILGSPTIAPSIQQQLLVTNIQNTIRTFDASTDLPYRGNGPGLIVLESEHEAGLADEVARYYPDAQRRRIIPPNGVKSTADELVLDPGVLAAHRGLTASRLPDGTWRADLGADVPGPYAFHVADGFSLTVDGAGVVNDRPVDLARGNHLITLSGPNATPSLAWQPPNASGFQPVEDRLLFAAPEGGNGLEATFFPGIDFQGSPSERIIDPILAHYYHVSPFARLNLSPQTWSVEWRGEIDVPTNGAYRFEADRLSRAGLWIDDQQVFDDTSDGPAPTQGGSIQLTGGRHQIRARMQQRGDGGPHLYLYWSPPGGGREIVPGRVLYPPTPQ